MDIHLFEIFGVFTLDIYNLLDQRICQVDMISCSR